tara:strand:+ start:184 stop:327 length:144 start_codon:yes stop_codon:yes gene_type:complete
VVFLKKENRIYFSPPGGIGRRTGLKILRIVKSVPVQVRGRAPKKYYN